MQEYKFYGEPDRRPPDAHKDSPQKPEPYIPDRELIQAVNLAVFLRRPLLLEGEAGCGKTRLAIAVAYELGLPFYRWNVRSGSKAEEGLYTYDAILRLHDVQVKDKGGSVDRNPQDAKQYRELGALGNAFQLKDRPAVVLIDEIDKADLDFPNDLLTVLDDPWAFTIRETGEKIQATPGCEPIVIVTSNKEKGNLPAPFLRRCLYYYVSFPDDPNRLTNIVVAHYRAQAQDAESASPKLSSGLVEAAIARFLDLRRDGGLFKPPGTSEFLDWLHALHRFEPKPYSAPKLKDTTAPLPYPELLFKLRDDWRKFARTP